MSKLDFTADECFARRSHVREAIGAAVFDWLRRRLRIRETRSVGTT